jgi:hypothetical protein
MSADEEDALLRAKVNLETSRIAWKELQRFFAAGTVIMVDAELDLVEVAFQMSQDNKAMFEAWMSSGKVARVSDAQAQEWYQRDAMLWAVVVKPWVLVRESE